MRSKTVEYKTRQCKKCGKQRNLKHYSKQWNDKYQKYYYRTMCKPCDSLQFKEYCNSNWEKRLFGVTKARAIKKNQDFELTIEDIKALYKKQKGKCYYLNLDLEPDYSQGHHGNFNPSLDRVDNAKGYLKNNVVLCSAYANKMKGAMTKRDFIRTLSKVKQGLNTIKDL